MDFTVDGSEEINYSGEIAAEAAQVSLTARCIRSLTIANGFEFLCSHQT